MRTFIARQLHPEAGNSIMAGEARSRQSKREGTGIGVGWMARNKIRKAESQTRMPQMTQPCISERASYVRVLLELFLDP
jgi:hypothetical protein